MADLAAALHPQHPLRLQLIAGALTVAACVVAAVFGPTFASVPAAAALSCLTVVSARTHRARHRWVRIAGFGEAEFAVAGVWLDRTIHSHPPDHAMFSRVQQLRAAALSSTDAEFASFADEIRGVARRSNRSSATVRVRKPPQGATPVRSCHGHGPDECPLVSRAELDVVAILAESPMLRDMWRHCTPVEALTSQVHMAQSVAGACTDVPPDVVVVAAGLARAAHDVLTVFEALDIAALVLTNPDDYDHRETTGVGSPAAPVALQ